MNWPTYDLPPINLFSLGFWYRQQPHGCVNKCRADPTRTFCTGCGRTIEEIAQKGLDK